MGPTSRRSLTAWLGLIVMAVAPLAAAAQLEEDFERHVSLEGRVGATLPTGDLKDIDATASAALTLNLLYNLTPQWAGYFGWGFHDFGCDGCPDVVRSTGFHGGAQYTFPWRGSALPWARGGLVLGALTLFQAGAEVDSGNELGLEIGTGVDFQVAEHVKLSPGAAFIFYSAGGLPDENLYVPYFVVDVGARYSF